MRLTLVVENTKDLNGGTPAACMFDHEGGSVGADDSNKWQLTDRHGSVDNSHLDIFMADGFFCGKVVSKKGITINHSQRPVRRGNPFRIRDGDNLKIGRFSVSAIVEASGEEGEGSYGEKWVRRYTSLETLVPSATEPADNNKVKVDDILSGKSDGSENYMFLNKGNRKDDTPLDPMVLLEDATGSTLNMEDPVAALDQEFKKLESRDSDRLSDRVRKRLASPEAGRGLDDPGPADLHIDLPRIRHEGVVEVAPSRTTSNGNNPARDELDDYLDQLSQNQTRERQSSAHIDNDPTTIEELEEFESWTGDIRPEAQGALDDEDMVDHVVLRPLLSALGIPVREMSVPEANRLTREIGEAIHSTIAGIMSVHQSQMTDRSLLNDTQLHLVEDNPLRLETDPDAAIKDLFFNSSPVHLSAGAAINESFEQISNHEQASSMATEAALTAVLQALSPLALAKRFAKYRGHTPRTGNLDAWHWQMYQHYYNEMKTDRQKGLGRMFWEIYRQVYSQEMRKQSVE